MKKVIRTEVLLVLLLAGVMFLLLYKKEPENVRLEQVRRAIASSCDLTGMEEARDMRLKRAFGFGEADYEEYLYYAPVNTLSVDEVLIVKTGSTSQASRIRAGIEARIAAEKTAFDGYGTEQIALLNNAKLVEDGPYIVYACGAHAGDFVAAARKVWGN